MTTSDPTTLTGPVSGQEYEQVLLARQAAYLAAQQQSGPRLRYVPLLEWFVRAEDAKYVQLPETKAP